MKDQMTKDSRLASLDALRGFDMMFIMGVASLVAAVCGLFPGGSDCWLAQQMEHVDWNGWHHHDTIFPLFLFIAGISFPFSFAKQLSSGRSLGQVRLKIVRRGLMLVFLGFLYNGLLNLHLDHFRFYSVLGRIGLAWMFAALLFVRFGPRVRAILSAAILLGYWLLCRIPAPDVPGADPLSMEGCLVGYIDRCILPGHLHETVFDPEGLLSTLPAIVTALMGMFAGELVRGDLFKGKRLSGSGKTLYMLGAALVCFALGYVWNIWFPINKKLWTSSFVLVLAGFSLASFALFYWVIDVKGWKRWAFPFCVIGMNSITIYLAPKVIDFFRFSNFFLSGILERMEPAAAGVVCIAGMLAVKWLFLYFLYKKNIFLKV